MILKLKYLFVINYIFAFSTSAENHHVEKRALLFPRATVLQFSYGLTVPLVLPRRSINLSAGMQVNYNLPYSTANFQTKIIEARDKTIMIDLSRDALYKYIIQFLDSFGLDGETCLLRSICEISEFPMHIGYNEHLLEKIVHFIFTPSLELDFQNQNATKHDEMIFTNKLLLAENVGKHNGNCDQVFSDCIVSIVDLFTSKYII